MPLRRLLEDLCSRPSIVLALAEQIPAGIALHAEDGTLVALNPTMERLFAGVVAADTEGPFSYPLRPCEGCEEAFNGGPLSHALAGGVVRQVECVLDRSDGTARLVTASAVPLRNADGRLTGAVLMLVDLTELRAAAALEKEVLGMVTHDLRNPLAAVRMLAQQLDRVAELTDERRHDLAARMLASIKRMESLLGALTDYTRARSGAALRLHRECIDLAALTRRVISEHEGSFPGRFCEVDVIGDPVGWWDESRIEQITSNLLSNAFRHGAPEATVRVRIDGRRTTAVEIDVLNDGPAIPPDLLPHLFEPFKPEHRSAGRGLGLGLFIVKHLVEAHGGTISVRSGERDGTAFAVVLPRQSDG